MVETTACAPDTSKSPITTFALNSQLLTGEDGSCTGTTYPCFEKAKATSLPIPFAPPACSSCSNDTCMRRTHVYHVPVRTTTLPLARSAYMNSSSSETTVVMALVDGEPVKSKERSKVKARALAIWSCYSRVGCARWQLAGTVQYVTLPVRSSLEPSPRASTLFSLLFSTLYPYCLPKKPRTASASKRSP